MELTREEYQKIIGETLKKSRTKKNISQVEAGKKVAKSDTIIGRYEKGIIDIPGSSIPMLMDFYDRKLSVIDYELSAYRRTKEEQARKAREMQHQEAESSNSSTIMMGYMLSNDKFEQPAYKQPLKKESVQQDKELVSTEMEWPEDQAAMITSSQKEEYDHAMQFLFEVSSEINLPSQVQRLLQYTLRLGYAKTNEKIDLVINDGNGEQFIIEAMTLSENKDFR